MGTTVGDHVRVRYDPTNPSRAVAPDGPSIDPHTVVLALMFLIVGATPALFAPPAFRALGMRAWHRVRDGRMPGEQGAFRRLQRAVHGVWSTVGGTAHQMGPVKSLVLLVVLPALISATFVLLTVLEVQRLTGFADRTVPSSAVVLGSSWTSLGRTDLDLELPDGTQATATRWDGVPRAGDIVDVVYDPAYPSRATMTGFRPWGAPQLVGAGLAVLGTITTATLASAAVAGLVGRRSEPVTTPET